MCQLEVCTKHNPATLVNLCEQFTDSLQPTHFNQDAASTYGSWSSCNSCKLVRTIHNLNSQDCCSYVQQASDRRRFKTSRSNTGTSSSYNFCIPCPLLFYSMRVCLHCSHTSYLFLALPLSYRVKNGFLGLY